MVELSHRIWKILRKAGKGRSMCVSSPEEISLGSSHSLYFSCLFRCLFLWAAVILVPSSPREIPQPSARAGRVPVGILALSSPVLEHSGCFGTIRENGKAKAKHGTIKNSDCCFPCFRSFVCLNHAAKTFCLLFKRCFGFYITKTGKVYGLFWLKLFKCV